MVVLDPVSAVRRRRRRRARVAALAVTVSSALVTAVGCREFQEALQGVLLDAFSNSGQPSGDGDGDAPNDDDGAVSLPIVALSASNPTPQLNEQVQLQCSVTNDNVGAVTFDFQPANQLSSVNEEAGTATLIIEQADLGASLAFICAATNAAGTGPASNIVVILPTPLSP